MMKKIVAAVVLTGMAINAHAVEPAAGMLDADNLQVEFTGGPFAAANVTDDGTGVTGGPTCADPVFPCDDFALTVNLSEDFVAVYPSALVRIVLALDDPGLDVREDYDMYLYDGDGNLIQSSISEGSSESFVFLANPGTFDFVVRVIPYTATNSSYKGLAEIFPGEPVEPVDESEADAESRAAATSTVAGGSLGWMALLVAAAVGLRRLRG